MEIANNNQSILVTTTKDFLRIPENYKTIIHKLDGEIVLKNEDALQKVLSDILEKKIFEK